MHRMAATLIAALVVAMSSGAFAQARPDLSGTWQLNQVKSSPGVAGNSPDIAFPSRLVVAQSPTELSVERTSVRQAPISAKYALDGSQVTLKAPAGITETAQARFDGSILVIASRRSFSSPAGEIVVEFRESWRVNGNILTVEKTVTQAGDSQTETAVYEKS